MTCCLLLFVVVVVVVVVVGFGFGFEVEVLVRQTCEKNFRNPFNLHLMDDFMSQLRVVQFSKQVFQIPPPQFSSVVKNIWKHVGM